MVFLALVLPQKLSLDLVLSVKLFRPYFHFAADTVLISDDDHSFSLSVHRNSAVKMKFCFLLFRQLFTLGGNFLLYSNR